MRGPDDQTSDIFTSSPRFARMYSDIGRPSIPPEQLLGALLLQSLYTVLATSRPPSSMKS
jgi:hypothetical protein